MKTDSATQLTGVARVQSGLGEALEEDLSTLACYAAGEIDELRLGCNSELRYVSLLAGRISDLFENVEAPTGFEPPPTRNFLLDPSVVVVMQRAIGDSPFTTSTIKNVDDLVHKTSQIRESLTRLSELRTNEVNRTTPEFDKLRDFCLALCRQASAYKSSMDDWSPQYR